MNPELQSVEAFGEYLLADDRTSFTFEEACTVAESLGLSIPTPVIRGLKDYGFQMVERPTEKKVRGFRSNSHDRWSGPGACKSYGGSGWEQINGFAGQEG